MKRKQTIFYCAKKILKSCKNAKKQWKVTKKKENTLEVMTAIDNSKR